MVRCSAHAAFPRPCSGEYENFGSFVELEGAAAQFFMSIG